MTTFINNFYVRVFLLLLACSLAVISSLNIYISDKLPEAQEIREIELQVPLKIFTADSKLIGEFGEKRRSALKFDDIPPYFVKAVLAIGATLSLERASSLFVWVKRLPTHLAIECAAPQLT